MLHEEALTRAKFDLQLFGCWDLRSRGKPIPLGGREQRLIALLALHGRRARGYVAGTLWPETTEARALASLRVAAMRVRHTAVDLMEIDRTTIALSTKVHVDVDDVHRYATAIAEMPVTRPMLSALGGPALLPGWYDDWVAYERERLQHQRLRALESIARAGLEEANYDLAVTAALDAIAIEPLRESSHAIVIRAHLLVGNRSEAIGHYTAFARLLEEELAIAPSIDLVEMMSPLVARDTTRSRRVMGRSRGTVVPSPAPAPT